LGSFKGDGSQSKVELLNIKDTTCRRSFVVGPIKCRNPRTDNVWPGDANNDNTANHIDLLHIGMAFGAKGSPRLGTNLTAWRPQMAADWDEVFFDGRNFKFADASGDGVVDPQDIAVLQQNYGSSHGPFSPAKALPFTDLDPKITYKFPSNKQLPDSTTFEIPVVLGAANRIVKDIYGLAFSVFFDPAYIDASSIEVVVPTSWLGQPKVNLSYISKVYPKEGRIDIALSRTDQNEVSGYGELLFIKGIVVDLVGKAVTNIKTDYASINRLDGEQLPVNTSEDGEIELIDVPRSYGPERLRNRITIFPNPSYGLVTLSSAFGTINQIQILNTDGMPIGATILNRNQIEVDALPAGVYFLKVQVAGQTYYEKLVKQTP
jgi:Secretion system C-terminal sorting domain